MYSVKYSESETKSTQPRCIGLQSKLIEEKLSNTEVIVLPSFSNFLKSPPSPLFLAPSMSVDFPLPRKLEIFPEDGPPGTVLEVTGESLGKSAKDIAEVYVNGESVLPTFQWISPSKITVKAGATGKELYTSRVTVAA